MALECAGRGVTIQALCPGFTYTEFHDRLGFDRGNVPKMLWMSAERVIDESLAAATAGGPVVVVPGTRYKLIVWALKYAAWVLAPLRKGHRRD